MKVLAPHKPKLPQSAPGMAISVAPCGHYLWLEDYEYYDQLGRDPMQVARTWLIKDDAERAAQFTKEVLEEYPKKVHRRNMLDTAARRGDEVIVRVLVETGLKVHPDMAKISEEQEEKDQAMRENGEIPDRDDRSVAPLHAAARQGHLGCVKILIEEGGAEVDARDMYGQTPLLLGAEFPDMVAYLLGKGADPRVSTSDVSEGGDEKDGGNDEKDNDDDGGDEEGVTAVLVAAAAGSLESLRLLLDHPFGGSSRKRKNKANDNDENLIGPSVVKAGARATRGAGYETLIFLLERAGYPMKAKDGKTKVEQLTDVQRKVLEEATPSAAVDGTLESLKLLLSYQFPVDLDGNLLPFEVPERLHKPFTYAAYNAMAQDSVEKFEFIRSFGVTQHETMSLDKLPEGQTLNIQHLLDAAAEAGSLKCVDLMVQKYGADVNLHRWPCGVKPLYAAACAGKVDVVKQMIKAYGANIHHGSGRFAAGPTALWIAVSMKSLDTVEFLLEQGGPVDKIDEQIKSFSKPMTVILRAEQKKGHTWVYLATEDNSKEFIEKWRSDWQSQNPPYVRLEIKPDEDKGWVDNIQMRLSAEELKETGNNARELNKENAVSLKGLDDTDPRKLSNPSPVFADRRDELDNDPDLIPKFEPYLVPVRRGEDSDKD